MNKKNNKNKEKKKNKNMIKSKNKNNNIFLKNQAWTLGDLTIGSGNKLHFPFFKCIITYEICFSVKNTFCYIALLKAL